jgi:glycosyltransferase involved in cell wall biosynthesis
MLFRRPVTRPVDVVAKENQQKSHSALIDLYFVKFVSAYLYLTTKEQSLAHLTKAKKIVCVVWAPSSSRMDDFSAELGARRFYLTFRYGPRFLAPLRYLILFFSTGLLLIRNNPSVILAQNPPTTCPLTCLLYASIFRKKVIIDHHAVWAIKTFGNSSLKKPILFLEKLASRWAFANTTPHPKWSEEFQKLGAKRVLTIYDFVQTESGGMKDGTREKYLDKGTDFLALAPHGGHELERIENEVEAMRSLPKITSLLTGPPAKLSGRLAKANLPKNVHYLGFLPFSEYSKILDSIDVGLNVSDEPYTISHCLLQFASRAVPAISTRQEAVEELFGDSLYYLRSSMTKDIEQGLLTLTSSPELRGEYSSRLAAKQSEFESKHTQAMQSLKDLL